MKNKKLSIDCDAYLLGTSKTINETILSYKILKESSNSEVLIVCPESAKTEYLKHVAKFNDVVSEYSLCDVDNIKQKIHNIVASKKIHDRVNWYFQQYLKLKIAGSNAQKLLILDGDTVFNPDFIARIVSNNIISTTKENVHQYNRCLSLLGYDISNHTDSYVTNYALIEPRFFESKLSNIETFFFEWLDLLEPSNQIEMSEYQFFGMVMLSSKKYISAPMKIFRRADLLKCHIDDYTFVNKLLERYDAVAFEYGHKNNYIYKIAARVYATFGFSW